MANDMTRVPVEEMTDTEMLREIVTNMRAVSDAVEMLQEHPLVSAIANGQNPMLAMMGR